MSAELLRRAADRIEQLAADCPTNTAEYKHLCSFLSRGNGGVIGQPTLRWWYVMGPQIGAPLAAWLRGEASDSEQCDCEYDCSLEKWNAAVAFARVILGEQP